MSTADLSNLLTSISKCNAARVVGALVSIDRWGERITYTQILGALEALTGASDLSIVYRGLQRAIDDGLIVEVRRNGTAYGYLPGPALERVLNATRRRALA